MRTLIAVFTLFVSLSSWAQIAISPKDLGAMVHPGDLVEARVQVLDEGLVNVLKPTTIRKAGDSKTFLFMGLSPLQKDATGWHLQAKIVMGPEFSPDKTYSLVAGDRTIEITFKSWMWNPQAPQVAQEFDYENVPLFSRSWFRKNIILVSIVLVILLAVGGYFGNQFRLKTKAKRAHAKKSHRLAQNCIRCE